MADSVTKQDLIELKESLAAVFAGEIGSVHTQIQQSEARITAKLDDINARLNTHAGLLQSGARQFVRFFQFSERSGRNWRALAKRVDAIERKLEGGKS